MLTASKLMRHPVLSSTVFPSSFSYNHLMSQKMSSIKFQNAAPEGHGTQEPSNTEKMEKKPNAEKTRGESMDSFGEGYSTRSDDDGFGGVYGGNQDQAMNKEEENHSSVNSPHEYDTSQGSEVKEKEKARHQKHDHT